MKNAEITVLVVNCEDNRMKCFDKEVNMTVKLKEWLGGCFGLQARYLQRKRDPSWIVRDT